MRNIPAELYIQYTKDTHKLENIANGDFVKIVNGNTVPEAQYRQVSQQEIIQRSPVENIVGFIHSFIFLN